MAARLTSGDGASGGAIPSDGDANGASPSDAGASADANDGPSAPVRA